MHILMWESRRVVVARGGRIIGVAPDAEDPSVSALGSIVAADGLNIGMLKVGAQVPDVFAPAVAAKLRKHILADGNTVDRGEAYRAFRGRDPDVKALLEKRGFPTK